MYVYLFHFLFLLNIMYFHHVLFLEFYLILRKTIFQQNNHIFSIVYLVDQIDLYFLMDTYFQLFLLFLDLLYLYYYYLVYYFRNQQMNLIFLDEYDLHCVLLSQQKIKK